MFKSLIDKIFQSNLAGCLATLADDMLIISY